MWRRLLVLTGLVALIAYVLRRPRPAPAKLEGYAGDPAQELRRKLDETRGRAEAEPEPELTEDLDDRRRDVHERARAAADEMRGSSSA
jgi:hypothetical protein